MQEFSALFEGVEDPRCSNATRHSLHEMLMIALLSTLCGGEGCADMERFGRAKELFLRRFMVLEHGIPSHDAFSDLFNALDPGGLQRVLLRLLEDWAAVLDGDVIAIDGKSLRRSFADAAARSPVHLVQAFAARARLVLGQVKVADKSNEIAAMPKLLEMLALKGRIVTADAMHTQRTTAEAVLPTPGGPAPEAGQVVRGKPVPQQSGLMTQVPKVCPVVRRRRRRSGLLLPFPQIAEIRLEQASFAQPRQERLQALLDQGAVGVVLREVDQPDGMRRGRRRQTASTSPASIGIVAVGIALASLPVGLFAWLRSDIRDLTVRVAGVDERLRAVEAGLAEVRGHLTFVRDYITGRNEAAPARLKRRAPTNKRPGYPTTGSAVPACLSVSVGRRARPTARSAPDRPRAPHTSVRHPGTPAGPPGTRPTNPERTRDGNAVPGVTERLPRTMTFTRLPGIRIASRYSPMPCLAGNCRRISQGC